MYRLLRCSSSSGIVANSTLLLSSTAQPLSSTSQNPEAPPKHFEAPSTSSNTSNGVHGSSSEKIVSDPLEESQEELEARCHEIMRQQKVMLFMKGNPDAPRCGFSQKTVALLREQKVDFGWFDILEDEAVRQGKLHTQVLFHSRFHTVLIMYSATLQN